MDDPLFVRDFQRLGDLRGDGQRLIDRDRPLSDAIGQGRPLDQLHHQRGVAIHPFEAVDRRDVRMIQRRQDFGFALKSGEPLRVTRDGLWQHLDGDLSLQVRVGGPVHLAHAACPERADDLVWPEPDPR